VFSVFFDNCRVFHKNAVFFLRMPCFFAILLAFSFSQYTLVNAPQRQNFTDNNLALHVLMAFNARS